MMVIMKSGMMILMMMMTVKMKIKIKHSHGLNDSTIGIHEN